MLAGDRTENCGVRGPKPSSQKQITICSSQFNQHRLDPLTGLVPCAGLLDKQHMVPYSLGGVMDTRTSSSWKALASTERTGRLCKVPWESRAEDWHSCVSHVPSLTSVPYAEHLFSACSCQSIVNVQPVLPCLEWECSSLQNTFTHTCLTHGATKVLVFSLELSFA